MAKIIWTEQSIEDIDNIAEFIARDSFLYAQIQVEMFFELAEKLKTNPFIGRRVPESEDDSIRELIKGNYRMIYKLRLDGDILILTIHHSKRSLKNNPSV